MAIRPKGQRHSHDNDVIQIEMRGVVAAAVVGEMVDNVVVVAMTQVTEILKRRDWTSQRTTLPK